MYLIQNFVILGGDRRQFYLASQLMASGFSVACHQVPGLPDTHPSLHAALAQAEGCAVRTQEPLAQHTTFRIGGPAALWVEVPTADVMAELHRACAESRVPCVVLGCGSNVLASDAGFNGVILHPAAPEFTQIAVTGGTVTAGAGAKLSALAVCARDHGLSGLEFAYGIPGSVGGAVYMNAGAYGGEIKDVLVRCTVLTRDHRIETRSAGALALAYRHSALMDDDAIVLSAEFALTPGDPEQIGAQMNDYMARRKAKQPLDLPSAGSTFKRPAGAFAGALIEQCGLKGARVGDAQVSEKHAGFIVNTGNATSADIHELMKQVRKRVYDNSNVLLEPEIILLPPDYKLEDRGPQVPRNKFIGLEEMTGGPDGGSAPDAE